MLFRSIVSVDDPEPLTDAGLKLAVAPLGSPLALSITAPVNPFCAVTDTVYVVLLPAVTVWVAGAAASEKFACAAAFTVKLTVALWLKLPLVPVMVSVEVAAGVELPVAIVSVDDPEPLTDAGLKLAVVPLGNPLAASVTAPVNPFCAATLTV